MRRFLKIYKEKGKGNAMIYVYIEMDEKLYQAWKNYFEVSSLIGIWNRCTWIKNVMAHVDS